MERRKFLRVGMTGIAMISLGPLAACGNNKNRPGGDGGAGGDDGGTGGDGGGGAGADVTVNLSIEEALFEMVDGSLVYMWAFQDRNDELTALPRLPGPVISAVTGQSVQITVTNNLDEDHAFSVLDLPGSEITVPPGETRSVTFAAPAAGTYLYLDPLNAPVNRVLGLHGALVVLPAGGNTPYTSPTAAVQQLFDDLGTTDHFPRHALSPAGWQRERSRIWLFHQVDPAFNARVQAGEVLDPSELAENFRPRYFTINGKSGIFSAHDHDSSISGRIGQPMLVRQLNAGLFAHSPHLHANHFYVTAVDNVVQDNVFFLDTHNLYPLGRVDWLIAFIRPPDIPGSQDIPLRDLIPNELALVVDGPNGAAGVPQTPLVYPMHCHNEPSQTAAGGNYPQGAVVHISFLGDIDGVDFPEPM
jgi:FtsP/CotA-like multicopper oxidase with cupredoxin domain